MVCWVERTRRCPSVCRTPSSKRIALTWEAWLRCRAAYLINHIRVAVRFCVQTYIRGVFTHIKQRKPAMFAPKMMLVIIP